MKYDFSGYATKNDLRCKDGRVIRKNAFKDCDGVTVPLVWKHMHDSPENVLGHALLENRDDGVYCYCSLNSTESGKTARDLVKHGDIKSLSIYANDLIQKGKDVMHGAIREVSLVIAGANPGAKIDNLSFQHGDGTYDYMDDEAIIYSGSEFDEEDEYLYHAKDDEEDDEDDEEDDNENMEDDEEENPKKKKGKTIKDTIATMNKDQKTAMYALIAQALQSKGKGSSEEDKAEHSEDDLEDFDAEYVDDPNYDNYDEDFEHSEGGFDMKYNVFEGDGEMNGSHYLSHDEMSSIIDDAKRCGSLKESVIQHGITDIETLFPEPKNQNNPPDWIKRDTDWVSRVMSGVHNTPFSRIKSSFANITEDEARAKGYIKGKLKKEEVFSLLKRTTGPQTIYKKQKLDRDDVIDITDFDVISWIKSEMRVMLDEELARAILIGDGRLNSDDDKIKEDCIRPIAHDDALYTIHYDVVQSGTDEDADARAIIKAAVKARKDYKGSGNPVLFTTEDILTNMLLIEDLNKRVVYDSVDKLATAMRVTSIITVPVMENAKNKDGDKDLLGIIVNLNDYNVGADKGGSVNMFEDFDIDYNAQKYLIETRCSGALVKPYSAIALEAVSA